MAEFRVVVLEEATKEMMMKEQYKLDNMGKDEWDIHEECNMVDEKLTKIDEWYRHKSKCGCGYKNRRR